MKHGFKPLSTSVAAAVLSVGMAAPMMAQAEISAEVSVASSYFWRGIEVSDGPQLSADLSYSHESGVYAGLWVSSEGFDLGNEYDLYVGWAGEFGGVGVDIGAVTYVYPSSGESAVNDPGDFSDIYLGLSFGDFSITGYKNVAAVSGNYYIVGDYTYGPFTLAVGYQEYGNADDNLSYTHVNLTYNYNDRLAFTIGGIVDYDGDIAKGWPAGGAGDIDTNRAKFIVSYTLPLEL